MAQDLVIGSGPSGVSVASALLAMGRNVLMIDGGKAVAALDADLQARVRAAEPSEWTNADKNAWQTPQFEAGDGQIRRYGSDNGLEPPEQVFDAASDPVAMRASHAAGGLSNLWGAAVARYRPEDMSGWDIPAADMSDAYAAIDAFLPVQTVSTGPQATELLARQAEGGPVRLAPAQVAVSSGCKLCGMCLHGCPWELIWKSTQHLPALQANPRFQYRSGPPVRAIADLNAGVEVTLDDGEVLRGDRLFLAAGVLETARLVLQTGAVERLKLRDSQYGFIPFLHRWAAPARPDRLPLTTLPQAFAEIAPDGLSPHAIHAQIYGWNEYFARDLIANYGKKLPGSSPLWQALARRLLVAQVFLHSDHGDSIDLSLAGSGKLLAKVARNSEFDAIFSAAGQRLARGLRHAGAHGLLFAARRAKPGESFHLGASIPSVWEPGPGQSDLLGRPHGLQNVHVVDASTIPAVPARTITYSVMANAWRIGAATAG